MKKKANNGDQIEECKFTIQILGKPQVLLNDNPLKVERRKARAIVYYVAAHRHPVSREELLALLWPEQELHAAQHTLSVILHDIRKRLCGLLIADKNLLTLTPGVEVDVRLFEERLLSPVKDLNLINETLKMHHGCFLDGFSLPDSLEYCNWMDAERERYDRMMIRGLFVAAELYEKQRSYHLALELLKQALALDSLQEDIHRYCMRLQYLIGDRPGAVRQYQKLCKLLDEEIGVPPMPQTKALYDAIITDTSPDLLVKETASFLQTHTKRPKSPSNSNPPDPMPFAGRHDELKRLQELTKKKNIGLILIEGKPGIGKTRMAEEFIRQSDALIMRGISREMERILPYQPIIEAFRELISRPDWAILDEIIQSGLTPIWREEIERLIPEMKRTFSTDKTVDITEDKHFLWEAINQFLLVLSRYRPVLFVLDDLHWADNSTLGLLSYLVRQTRDEQIIFIGITRPFNRKSGLAKLVQALAREMETIRILLHPLVFDDVTFLAQHYSQNHTVALAECLMRISEGNPYFLKEVVQYMLEHNILSTNGSLNCDALANNKILPITVRNFIQVRLERFSETARRVLDTAAVIGREFDFAVLAKAVSLAEDAVLDGLGELCSQGMIQTTGGNRYSFDHSLTREVAYCEIEPSRRQSLHRRIAEALECTRGDQPESAEGMIAWHFGESNMPERAAPYALRAGYYSLRFAAWNEAIAFYEQAFKYLGDPDRISVLHNIGIMLTADIQGTKAAEIYRKAAALAKSQGKAAYTEFFLGVASYIETPDFSEILWGMTPIIPGEALPEATKHLKKAEALIADSNLDELEPNIKLVLGLAEARQGNLLQAVAYCKEGIAKALESENADYMLRIILVIKMNLSALLQIIGDPTAKEMALTALSTAQEKGIFYLQPQLLSVLGKIALAESDYESAEQYLNQGLALAERMSLLYVVSDITDCLGRLALRRGQKELAVSKFLKALNSADKLGMRHQAIQIRMRLVPLIPPSEAKTRIAEVLDLADERIPRLLEQIEQLEIEIGAN
ncbi:Transcriptional activator domain [Desulfitobacterium hafniense]|uniref:Transcriptional activator domain n=1 Tax=Desulfitobacterium hafniense TaxID=49338 RepID=A0A098B6I3_DESHA|nr:Transcriptional activator domain [Desulfitobacterium hafniense]